MKYYMYYIADFNNATRHLTRLERSLYRDMIDMYYETEKQLPLDVNEICRKILANGESTDVQRLLNEFFTETPTGWWNCKCEEVIETFHNNKSQKALAGKASAEKKKQKKLNALLEIENKPTAIQHPLKSVTTESHGTSTNLNLNLNLKDNKNTALTRPDIVSQDVWNDFLTLRKAKKAPLTKTALNGIENEARKAGMTLEAAMVMACNRGWTAFKADWMTNKQVFNKNAGAGAAIFEGAIHV